MPSINRASLDTSQSNKSDVPSIESTRLQGHCSRCEMINIRICYKKRSKANDHRMHIDINSYFVKRFM
jgi:hypothetical protein